MHSRTSHPRGYTVTEMMIVSAIMVLIGSVAFFSAAGYYKRKEAARCGNMIQALYNALNEYGIDKKLRNGSVVNIESLVPRYIPKADQFVCPTSKRMFGTNFIYGRIPVCPGGYTNHAWVPPEALKL